MGQSGRFRSVYGSLQIPAPKSAAREDGVTEVLLNWLKADGRFVQKRNGREVEIFSGPAPFSSDKSNSEEMARWWKVPWVISHPLASKNHTYRLVGLESYALAHISQGQMVGLLVERMG